MSFGRNEPCYCGSGKKYKNCHWLENLVEQEQKENINAWDILEMEGGTKEEVKAQYKKLALQYHPDKKGSNKKFSNLKKAYDIVINHFYEIELPDNPTLPELVEFLDKFYIEEIGHSFPILGRLVYQLKIKYAKKGGDYNKYGWGIDFS